MTASDDELANTLAARAPEAPTLPTLPTLVGSETAFAEHPSATLRPPASASESASHRALVALSREASNTTALQIESTIGEGGMGVVKLATQRSLGRRVVVKTLRTDIQQPDAALSLLREAWITGGLEHPNIVPVHDLVLDPSGTPIIVLKRIEGVTWSALIRDPERAKNETHAEDALSAHLGIFGQVCNAMSLAHARGIIHRDLKPDNVMVGAFGEVYVVDWGIAVSLRDDAGGRLPLAANATEVAGTPAYMAPEMLGGKEPRIDAQTDVYLLGAILFEVLTGKAPHEGKDFHDIVASILASAPVLPDTAPRELARICKKAMSPSPGDRFRSIEELRAAVTAFQRHRGSDMLARDAHARLEELRRMIAADSLASGDARARLYNVFGECRFGFRQALRTWPENPVALAGLREACVAMVEVELAAGFPEKAAVVLLEIDSPPEVLARKVETATIAQAREREKAERIRQEFDPAIGRPKRAMWGALTGLFFTLTPVPMWWAEAHGDRPTAGRSMRGAAAAFLLTCLVLFLGRRSLAKTPVNRRVALSILFTFAAQLALELGGVGLGFPADRMIVVHFFLWFVVAGVASITIDRRVFPSAITYLTGFLYLCHAPDDRWPVMILCNLVLAANLLLAWASPMEAQRGRNQ